MAFSPPSKPPLYGVVVVGPPGAGKSTMCAGLARYLELAKRPCAVINLDPACEEAKTPFSIDVRNLVRVDTVMREQKLGANGALMYCVKVLKESTWLAEKLASLGTPYCLFDLPGQIELWTHSEDLRDILRSLDARLVVANVVDANHCTRPATYVANLLASLVAMLNLELPHVNVLSKLDQLPHFEASMPFHLNYFTDATDLHRLLPFCRHGDAPAVYSRDDDDDQDDDDLTMDKDDKDDDDKDDDDGELPPPPPMPPPMPGSVRLTSKICELVEDYNLVCFQPLDITDGDSVAELLRILDKANGHPAGVYDAVRLIDDPAPLFLAREETPDDAFQQQQQQRKDPVSTKSLRRTGDDQDDEHREATRRWLKERR